MRWKVIAWWALGIIFVMILGAFLLLPPALGPSDTQVPLKSEPYDFYVKDDTVVGTAYSFKVSTIDSTTIPCVYVARSLSCDWSKETK